uniref:RGS domain-containing protein n=1 Tax=Romanomermis culicivorax TaxID=13658 RepID=A0A915IF01_ROMCU
ADVIKSLEYRKSSDSSLHLDSDGAKSPPAVLRSRTSTGSLEYSESVVNPLNADAATGVKCVDAAPFENFEKLRPRIGHLAVFLHYLLSNSDPASLIFYLVSELYRNGAPTKECRIWAYELYSTFLHANAPLRASCSDQLICQEIESILTDENLNKNEEKLKHAFDSSKLKAKDEIEELLADFRSKRAL